MLTCTNSLKREHAAELVTSLIARGKRIISSWKITTNRNQPGISVISILTTYTDGRWVNISRQATSNGSLINRWKIWTSLITKVVATRGWYLKLISSTRKNYIISIMITRSLRRKLKSWKYIVRLRQKNSTEIQHIRRWCPQVHTHIAQQGELRPALQELTIVPRTWSETDRNPSSSAIWSISLVKKLRRL